MGIILLKSVLHNIGVVIVGFIFAIIGTLLDAVLRISDFQSFITVSLGWVLITAGFLLRVLATDYFYTYHMKVISLKPQKKLITSGPYRISRNPLYLGGNVFIFFGAAFILGTPIGIILTCINIVLTDRTIRREEKQLAKQFGKEWAAYTKHVRRWI